MFRLIGKLLFFFIRFIIHLPFAVFHGLRRFFFGVNFDKMNGYEFEEYAARYLKRNGYSKITVTKASRAVSYTHLDVYKRQMGCWVSVL